MGCNSSKLDDEEAVQICKDRKKFIKQALEHRTKFACGHIAYVQALKRVSSALREYIEGDEPREFLLDSFITPPFTPVKKLTPKFITVSPKCFSTPAIQSEAHSSVRINYYRPGGQGSVSVEERPPSPEVYNVQSYPSMDHYGIDGFFGIQSPQNGSYYSSRSPYSRPEIPPPSPQNSQWDFFWNPFSSLDYYGYPMRSGFDQSLSDDDIAGLRQVREEEGIPELEEESEHEEIDVAPPQRVERIGVRMQNPVQMQNPARMQDSVHMQDPTHLQNSIHMQNPTHLQNSIHMQNPAHLHNSVHMQNPVHTQNPVHMQNPVHTQNPVHMQNLVHTQNPVHMQNPAHLQNSVHMQNLAHRQNPGHRQNSAHRQNPGHRQNPVHLQNPVHRQNPVHWHNPVYRQNLGHLQNPVHLRNSREEVTVEDVDEDDEDGSECECKEEDHHDLGGLELQRKEGVQLSQTPNTRQVEVNRHETAVSERQKKEEETPGFTVYVNRRPTSMDEVIKDLESQFVIVCNAANEVSALLEANRVQCLLTSNEVTAVKMLNPVALFRSSSSRSSSSRYLVNSSGGSRDGGYESSTDVSDESSMFSGSHHSTLDRLYAWEKRLYDEVRSGERIRRAYEKKVTQLRNQDVKGDDPSAMEKTRMALRDLHTQIKVSIHSIEAISKRIEALRDQELKPQLLELVQGLEKMWKVMAECHQMQKHTLDEAKLLLAGTPSKFNNSKRNSAISVTDPHRLARAASNLESELRNWKVCFESWIASQRSYVHALSGWLLRCMSCEPNTSKLPFSPRRSAGVHPIFGICIQWTRLLDAVREAQVLDGLDFFAAGMGSIYAQQLREDRRAAHNQSGGSRRFEDSGGSMDVVEMGQVEEVMTPEKMAEVAVRVLCAGMSVAMSSLTEFAFSSAEGYAELVNQWENVEWPPNNEGK